MTYTILTVRCNKCGTVQTAIPDNDFAYRCCKCNYRQFIELPYLLHVHNPDENNTWAPKKKT